MTRVIAGDAPVNKQEFGVALPNGHIVNNSDKLDVSYHDENHMGGVYTKPDAKKLADLFNRKYASLGAPQDAVAVERTVVVTYSDWTEVA